MTILPCKTTRFTSPNASIHLLCFMVLAMFEMLQAARSYVRSLHWLARLNPAIICLALVFVFLGAVGSMAQDTTRPTASFELPNDHDGITPFEVTIVFSEVVKENSVRKRLSPDLLDSDDTIYSVSQHGPDISGGGLDSTGLRYTFILTPKALLPLPVRVRLKKGFKDLANNKGQATDSDPIRYVSATINPIANAGEDQDVASGATVELDGSGSTRDRRAELSYSWTQTGGPNVTLSDATVQKPTFTAEIVAAGAANVTYVFDLTVTDNKGSPSSTDTVTVTVEAPITPPVANAGEDQDVASGATVELDGSGSTKDRRAELSYSWTQTGGPNVTLSDAAVQKPTFTAEIVAAGAANVTYVFDLTVTDNKESPSSTDTVTVTVEAPIAPPVANAGDDQDVASGATVELDGSGSTKDRRAELSYSWTQTGGPNVTLNDAAVQKPTFTAEIVAAGAANVTYVFELTVTDNKESPSSTDTVTVTVEAPITPPVANAGDDQDVASGATVELDGSGSTRDRRAELSYSWTQTGGPNVTLSDAAVQKPTFTAEIVAAGAANVTYVFELTVTDNKESPSSTDTVTVTVEAPITPPVANAGEDQDVASGATVELDGSGSTKDRRAELSYSWTQTGGPNVTLSDAAVQKPTFTAEIVAAGAANVTYVFELTVTDNKGSPSSTDTVTVTVEAPIAPPVANAGEDQEVASGATVELDGSGSTRDRRARLSYAWQRTGGNGASVTLSDANVTQPTFTAEIVAADAADVTYVFTLTVMDDKGSAHSTDTVTVTVGSMAQDTTPPTGIFELPLSHDGDTSFEGTIVFDEKVKENSVRKRLKAHSVGAGGPDYNESQHGPKISGGEIDSTGQRYTFTVIPRASLPVRVRLKKGFKDLAKNKGQAIESSIPYVRPIFAVPVADAGPDQEVASGATVELDGSGSTKDRRATLSYSWTQTGGPNVTLSDAAVQKLLDADGRTQRDAERCGGPKADLHGSKSGSRCCRRDICLRPDGNG